MLTIISFLLTLIGSINWLMIGLLQYDFIAGIFGYQASVLSRIVYIIIGASSAVLVFKLFKGKGSLNVLSKRNKKDLAEKIDKVRTGTLERGREALNVESGEDLFRESEKSEDISHGLFDEHFDNRSDERWTIEILQFWQSWLFYAVALYFLILFNYLWYELLLFIINAL